MLISLWFFIIFGKIVSFPEIFKNNFYLAVTEQLKFQHFTQRLWFLILLRDRISSDITKFHFTHNKNTINVQKTLLSR